MADSHTASSVRAAPLALHRIETGAGAPVVLLHGLFGQARNLGAVARGLAASGYRVVAFDLRNHGDSPHADSMSYAEMAADVAASAADLLPCPVIGHSMGGKVAMRLALARPALVSRLLVGDIAPVRYASAFETYAGAMQALPLAPGLTRPMADAALAAAVPDAGVRGFLLQNLRIGGMPAWRCGLDAIAASLPAILDWPPVAGQFDNKTLFLRGALSDYVLDAYRPAIRDAFPHAAVITLKQAGHWLHVDNPAGFLATAEAFLRG